MKNTCPKVAAILLVAAFSANLAAQTAANKTTEAGAVLSTAMSIQETAPLHFGSNTLTNSAGGIIVLPSNSTALSLSGGLAFSAATPSPTNAAYLVTGTALETYSLSLPTMTIVTHSSMTTGTNSMKITQITARFNGANADATTSTLSPDGTDSFTLGGTLQVGTNQLPGAYIGTFAVTVDYN